MSARECVRGVRAGRRAGERVCSMDERGLADELGQSRLVNLQSDELGQLADLVWKISGERATPNQPDEAHDVSHGERARAGRGARARGTR